MEFQINLVYRRPIIGGIVFALELPQSWVAGLYR